MKYTSKNTYRRINKPTRFEKWWDSLPSWVEVTVDIIKILVFLLIVYICFFSKY